MKKTWLICWHEFKRHVLRKRFIFAILSMPLFVGVLALVGFLSVWLQYDKRPVGYIDPYGILTAHEQLSAKAGQLLAPVEMIAYTDESAAKADLQAKKLQAYWVFTENYMDTGEVTLVSDGKTGINIEDDIGEFLTQNLLNGKAPALVTRLTEGSNLIIRSLDGKRELGADNWSFMLLPFIAGLLVQATAKLFRAQNLLSGQGVTRKGFLKALAGK